MGIRQTCKKVSEMPPKCTRQGSLFFSVLFLPLVLSPSSSLSMGRMMEGEVEAAQVLGREGTPTLTHAHGVDLFLSPQPI